MPCHVLIHCKQMDVHKVTYYVSFSILMIPSI